MDNVGMDSEALFLYAYSELDYYTDELIKLVPEDSFSLNYNLLKTIRKMLDIWQSIFLINENNQDFTSILCLLRTIVDHYAFINLLFVETIDLNEREIRLLLYLLDGLRTRRKSLSKSSSKFDPKITSEGEFYLIANQCRSTLESDIIAEKDIKVRIKKLSNGAINNNLIKHSYWQFINITNDTKFKWSELYDMLPINKDMADVFSNYLSQFIHGLGLSNIQYYNNQNCIGFTLSISTVILDKITKILKNELNQIITSEEIDFYKTNTFYLQYAASNESEKIHF